MARKKAFTVFIGLCVGVFLQTACNLAVMYFDSDIYPNAIQFFKKACDMGMAGSCINLGYIYANGKGVEKDDAAAATFNRKAHALQSH